MDRKRQDLIFAVIIGFMIGLVVGIIIILMSLQGYECVPKAQYEAMQDMLLPFLR